jgi:stage II sporulation protein D
MVNIGVGLIQERSAVVVELSGAFFDSSGKPYPPGRYRFASEITLSPSDLASCAFAVDNVTIGIGFHWERRERLVFRGGLRVIRRDTGLIVINDIPLEEYVVSVISSEMSASCPLELLKAHAVISRSWLCCPKVTAFNSGAARRENVDSQEIVRWYGRETHLEFDVCADDHCQRYQGITRAFSPAVTEAVRATAGEFLRYDGGICDARFSKCCGGVTECYATAWEDHEIPYLRSVCDGPAQLRLQEPETWIRSNPPAWCNTDDSELLSRVLPGFDQETRDFYRWSISYTAEEISALIGSRLGVDLGPIHDIEPLARGPSGRIYRLKITGERDYIIIGKELEIRRALSRSHLYSSAFVMDKHAGRFVLRGAGWGHGVGLCQIGAAGMANAGKTYSEILQHYYRGAVIST